MKANDPRPLWIQLAEEFRQRIVAGKWAPGAKLPSVRELALELGANPNTVQKALGELDRENLTQTERTSGRFVTSDARLVEKARLHLAAQAADTYLAAIRALGLTPAQAASLIEERSRKERSE